VTPEAQKLAAAEREFRLGLLQSTETCKTKSVACNGSKYDPTPSPRFADLPPRYNTLRVNRHEGRPHLPANVRQWYGDSRGRWEGNTLVIDVTNFAAARLAADHRRGEAGEIHPASSQMDRRPPLAAHEPSPSQCEG
jgi:hypothetical protein